ncbi:MAG TPA: TetR/AcrR family transcriptional regulator [Trebonia sp.]|nr:TetR/AcrR family transcriptional regulator [Trebonia sp.]
MDDKLQVLDDTPPGMRADARRSRAKLLEAATAAFAEHGADAPLEDIARRAGVGIGTLYRHFPTRLDLQSAVFLSQVKGVCAQADELMDNSPADQAFAAWVRALTSYMVAKRGLSKALVGALGRESKLISGCSLVMRETLDRLVARSQEAGTIRPDVTAMDVLRLVHGISIATEQVPEDTDRLLSLMLDGLRPANATGAQGQASAG